MRASWCFVCLALATFLASPAPAAAQQDDPPPHCGTYPDGRLRGCAGSGQGGMEATCMAQARVDICLYFRFNCQRGFALACRMAAVGQNCFGGNPQQCSYFQQLLIANRACALDGNQQACGYLRQQGLI